jgi:hypothetical protein
MKDDPEMVNGAAGAVAGESASMPVVFDRVIAGTPCVILLGEIFS